MTLVEAKVAISRELKKRPRVFDFVKRTMRSGSRDECYDALSKFSGQPATFIQIGSNDGISVDPLREFVVSNRSWSGVLIEPVPWIFERLVSNYAYVNRGQLRFLNAAIGAEQGVHEFWKIRDEYLKEFPPFAYQIGSFSRSHITKHFAGHPGINSKIESIQVRCETFASVCRSFDLKHVDILHMDVEGHETDILKTIDYSTYGPRLILFEISHMPEPEWSAISEMLSSLGYDVRPVGIDCIARRRD